MNTTFWRIIYFSKNPSTLQTLASLFKQSIRATYSNPPRQGALVVSEILGSTELQENWKTELESYKDRILEYRAKYKQSLEKLISRDFSYVEKGNGLFVFTGLSLNAVKTLREKEAIYLSSDGRLNLTGLNKKNFEIVIEAIAKYL